MAESTLEKEQQFNNEKEDLIRQFTNTIVVKTSRIVQTDQVRKIPRMCQTEPLVVPLEMSGFSVFEKKIEKETKAIEKCDKGLQTMNSIPAELFPVTDLFKINKELPVSTICITLLNKVGHIMRINESNSKDIFSQGEEMVRIKQECLMRNEEMLKLERERFELNETIRQRNKKIRCLEEEIEVLEKKVDFLDKKPGAEWVSLNLLENMGRIQKLYEEVKYELTCEKMVIEHLCEGWADFSLEEKIIQVREASRNAREEFLEGKDNEANMRISQAGLFEISRKTRELGKVRVERALASLPSKRGEGSRVQTTQMNFEDDRQLSALSFMRHGNEEEKTLKTLSVVDFRKE